jgi:phosphoribosylanthranilate isomerase
MAEAKICGITTPEALDAALAGGARYAGFVHYPPSPRHLPFDKLEALVRRVNKRAEVVIVTVDADDETLYRINGSLRPDWVQLHGAETPQRVAQAGVIASAKTIKALGVASAEDFTQAAAFAPAADMLMFDAKPPAGAGRTGGHGAAFDWSILAGRSFPRGWFLSGGLTSENVQEAIRASGAGLVDVSSGVESAPGLKDPAKIAAFLKAAHGPSA